MKKLFLSIVMLITAFSLVKALSHQGTATLNLHLHPVISIEVNSAQNVIDLHYKTLTNYKEGVSSEKLEDHLSIISTTGFEVNVKANNLLDGVREIESSTIELWTDAGNIKLGKEDKKLLSSSIGGVNMKYDVTYSGSGGNIYIEKYNKEGTNIYTTEVMYTVIAN